MNINPSTLITNAAKTAGTYLVKTATKAAAKSLGQKAINSMAQRSASYSIGLGENSASNGVGSDLDERLENAKSKGITLKDFWDMIGKDTKGKSGSLKKINNNKGCVRFVRTTVTKDGKSVPSVKIAKVGNQVDMGWCLRQNVSSGHNKALRELFAEKLIAEWQPFFENGKVSNQFGAALQTELTALKGFAYGWKFGDGGTFDENESVSDKRLGRIEVKAAKQYVDSLKTEENLKTLAQGFLSMKMEQAQMGLIDANRWEPVIQQYGTFALGEIMEKPQGLNKDEPQSWNLTDVMDYIVSGKGSKKSELVDKAENAKTGADNRTNKLANMKERMLLVGQALDKMFRAKKCDESIVSHIESIAKDSGNVDGEKEMFELHGQLSISVIMWKKELFPDDPMAPERNRLVNKATDCFVRNFFGVLPGGNLVKNGLFKMMLDKCRQTTGSKEEIKKELQNIFQLGKLRSIYADFVSYYRKDKENNQGLAPAIKKLKSQKKSLEEGMPKITEAANEENVKLVQDEIDGLAKQIGYLNMIQQGTDEKLAVTDDVKKALEAITDEFKNGGLMTNKELEEYNKKQPFPVRTHTVESLAEIFKVAVVGTVREEALESHIALRFMEEKGLAKDKGDYLRMSQDVIRDQLEKFTDAVRKQEKPGQKLTGPKLTDALKNYIRSQHLNALNKDGSNARLINTCINTLSEKCAAVIEKIPNPSQADADNMATVIFLIAAILRKEIEDTPFNERDAYNKVIGGVVGGLETALANYVRHSGINTNTKQTALENIKQNLQMDVPIVDFVEHELDDLLDDFGYQSEMDHQTAFVKTLHDRMATRIGMYLSRHTVDSYKSIYTGVFKQSFGEFEKSTDELQEMLERALQKKEDGSEVPLQKQEKASGVPLVNESGVQSPNQEKGSDVSQVNGSEVPLQKPETNPAGSPVNGSEVPAPGQGKAPAVSGSGSTEAVGMTKSAENQKKTAQQTDIVMNTNYEKDLLDKLTAKFSAIIGDDELIKSYVSDMRDDGLTFHPLGTSQQLAAQRLRLNALWARRVVQNCPGGLPWPLDKIRSGCLDLASFFKGIRETDQVKAEIKIQLHKTKIDEKWLNELSEGFQKDMRENAEQFKAFEEQFIKACRTCVKAVLDEAMNAASGKKDDPLVTIKDYPPSAQAVVVDNILSGLTDKMASFMLDYVKAPEAYESLVKDSVKMQEAVAKLLGIPPRYKKEPTNVIVRTVDNLVHDKKNAAEMLAEGAKTVVENKKHPIMKAITDVLQTRESNVAAWLKKVVLAEGEKLDADAPCYEKTESAVMDKLNDMAGNTGRTKESTMRFLFLALLTRKLEMIDKAPLLARSVSDFGKFVDGVAEMVWNDARDIIRNDTLVGHLENLIRELATKTNEMSKKLSKDLVYASALDQTPRLQRRAVAEMLNCALRGEMKTVPEANAIISRVVEQYEKDVGRADRLANKTNAKVAAELMDKGHKLGVALVKDLEQAGFGVLSVDSSRDDFIRTHCEAPLDEMLQKLYQRDETLGMRAVNEVNLPKDQKVPTVDDFSNTMENAAAAISNRLKGFGRLIDVGAWSEKVLADIKGDAGGEAFAKSLTPVLIDKAQKRASMYSNYLSAESKLAQAVMKGEVNPDELDKRKKNVQEEFESAFGMACRDVVYTGLANDAWADVKSSSLISQIDDKEALQSVHMNLVDSTVDFVKSKSLKMDEFKSQLADAMLGVKTDIWMLAHKKEVDNRIASIRQKLNNTAGFSVEDNRNSALEDYWKDFGDTYRAKLKKAVKDNLKNKEGELSKVDLTLDAFEKGNEYINERIEMHGTKTFIDGMKSNMAAKSPEVVAAQKGLKKKEAESNSTALFEFLSNRTPNADLQEKSPFFRLLSVLITGNSNRRAAALDDLALLIDGVMKHPGLDSDLMMKAKVVVKQFFSAYSETLSGAFPSDLTCEQVLAKQADLGVLQNQIDILEASEKKYKEKVKEYASDGEKNAADILQKSLEEFEGRKTDLKKQLLELNNAVNQVFTYLMKL